MDKEHCEGDKGQVWRLSMKAYLRSARLKVRREAKEGPFFLNIPTRASSYEVQIRAEALPWVEGIFSTKQRVRVEKSQRER